jgi:large subunit ribosomal protein L18
MVFFLLPTSKNNPISPKQIHGLVERKFPNRGKRPQSKGEDEQKRSTSMGYIHESQTHRRARRVRHKLRSVAPGKLRLSVFRSNMNISLQIIDDTKGVTLVSASSNEKALRKALGNTRGMNAAEQMGKTIAERALKAGIKEVYFDRGSYRYTGRISKLADAAREAGLKI